MLRCSSAAPRALRAVAAARKARGLASRASLPPNAPVIVAAARTPIGSYQGALAPVSAIELASVAVHEVVQRSNVPRADVNEAYLGNVISANLGQAPARQVVIKSGLPLSVTPTTINRVCASGMKATAIGAQSILLNQANVVVAGGFESMSNVPYMIDAAARRGLGYGHKTMVDGILRDGLWDALDDHHMGMCAEKCAKDHSFSRKDQDDFALESYRRAINATKAGLFKDEIVPVQVNTRKGNVTVTEDEEPKKLRAEKVPTLRPAFTRDGTVTAANSSAINDGAAALVLTSAEYARSRGLKALAHIRSFADFCQEPINFTTSPSHALPRALARAGLQASDVNYWEINEAFGVVVLANNKLLSLDPSRVNVNGGAVALGHPIGCSGARILVTLLNVLKQKDATIGAAGICNGGGGASAMVLERLQ